MLKQDIKDDIIHFNFINKQPTNLGILLREIHLYYLVPVGA